MLFLQDILFDNFFFFFFLFPLNQKRESHELFADLFYMFQLGLSQSLMLWHKLDSSSTANSGHCSAVLNKRNCHLSSTFNLLVPLQTYYVEKVIFAD